MIPLLSPLIHHGEPGDPVLMEWIKHQIDAILGLGDLALALALGAVVAAIPLAVLGFYAYERMRGGQAE